MIELPDECENTTEHLIIHIKSAKRALKDRDHDQFLHDIEMAQAIADNLLELENV